MLLIGVGLALTPLLQSLKPNAKARANVPTFTASDIPLGFYKAMAHGDFSLVVVRPRVNEYSIFWTGPRGITDRDYYVIHPGPIECYEFIITERTIRCEGPDIPSPEWTFDGRPAQGSPSWVPELELLPYTVLGDTVRFGNGA